jgi:phenylpyruvate tautomerase PptA (4-oxalocrotonate tautomerase family)
MPHIVVKMYPGRNEEAKARLAEAIVREVMLHAGSSETRFR